MKKTRKEKSKTIYYLDFLSEKQDGSRGLILVCSDFVLDVSGPVGVLEGVQGFHEVTVGRRNAGDHHGPAVAAEGVLKQPEINSLLKL